VYSRLHAETVAHRPPIWPGAGRLNASSLRFMHQRQQTGQLRNYFILDDRIVVHSILDANQHPISLKIIEDKDEVSRFVENFQELERVQSIGDEELGRFRSYTKRRSAPTPMSTGFTWKSIE